MNVTDIITRLVPQLHSDTVNNLSVWTECELIQWVDESVKRLARITGSFVERDITSISLALDQMRYTLPARHVATLFVTLDDKPLIPTSTTQLEALDPNWENADIDTPARWAEDKELGQLIIYPPPDPPNVSKTVGIIMLAYPAELDCPKVNTSVVLPKPLEDYCEIVALGKAYGKDSDLRLPEVASHAAQRAQLYEQICQKYWPAD